MIAATLIADLAQHGTRLAVMGERVRLIHPAGRPPPGALVQAAREAKNALREALTAIHTEIPPYDVMGLVWLLNGSTVVALDGEGATLRTRTGATQRWRRRPSGACH